MAGHTSVNQKGLGRRIRSGKSDRRRKGRIKGFGRGETDSMREVKVRRIRGGGKFNFGNLGSILCGIK